MCAVLCYMGRAVRAPRTHIAAEMVNSKRRLGWAHHNPLRGDRDEPGMSSARPWWSPDTALAMFCAAYLCEEK